MENYGNLWKIMGNNGKVEWESPRIWENPLEYGKTMEKYGHLGKNLGKRGNILHLPSSKLTVCD